MGTIKDFICDALGIETQAEKTLKEQKHIDNLGVLATANPVEATKEKDQIKKQEKWADINENRKFVCQGGEILCKYHSGNTGKLISTSTEVLLQDKPYVTSGDTKKENFLFTGQCTHSKWGSNKPMCVAVISPGKWKDCSTSYIDNFNPILVGSSISCMVSGEDLKVTNSGQISIPDNLSIYPSDIKVHIKKIDTEYFTPLGIQNPIKKDIETEGSIKLVYEISGEDAIRVKISVSDKNGDPIFSEVTLPEVIVVGSKSKTSNNTIENGVEEYIPSEFIPQGTHVWEWDGFDIERKLDTTRLLGKLTFEVRAYSQNGLTIATSTYTVKTKRAIKDSKWVDFKIDKSLDSVTNEPRNIIDVNLRVNMKEGRTIGLTEGYDIPIGVGISHRHIPADWEKVPSSSMMPGCPLITNTSPEVRTFTELEALALKGLDFHWSRNSKHQMGEGNNITVAGEPYEVNVHTENTTTNTMNDDIDLVFNTNSIWARSNNPGCITGLKSFVSNALQLIPFVPLNETIFYNVGYLINQLEIETLNPFNKEKWIYINGRSIYKKSEYNVDREFSFTAAHEIGHSILRAYSEEVGESTDYSYEHKGSSTYSETLSVAEGGFDYPKTGEIDLMMYYNNDPYWYDFNRIVAAEEDVIGLLWLTKIKIDSK